MGINTRCCENLTVKVIALALTDALCYRGIVSGIDGDHFCNGLGTTIRASTCYTICIRMAYGY